MSEYLAGTFDMAGDITLNKNGDFGAKVKHRDEGLLKLYAKKWGGKITKQRTGNYQWSLDSKQRTKLRLFLEEIQPNVKICKPQVTGALDLVTCDPDHLPEAERQFKMADNGIQEFNADVLRTRTALVVRDPPRDWMSLKRELISASDRRCFTLVFTGKMDDTMIKELLARKFNVVVSGSPPNTIIEWRYSSQIHENP